MTRHIIVARTADADGWWIGLDRHILSAGSASAEGVVRNALKMLRDEHGAADFSFTTRTASELLEHPLPDDPADLLYAALGASVMLMAPEGRPDDSSMWTTAWRSPYGGLSSPGIRSRFREQSLIDRVSAWFEAEGWASFRPETPSERASMQRIERPPFPRELCVRHGWRIRDLIPHAFAPPGLAFASR
jgi:hypothetical protein